MAVESIEREIKILIPFHLSAGEVNQTVAVKQSPHATSHMNIQGFAESVAQLVEEELKRATTGNYILTIQLK